MNKTNLKIYVLPSDTNLNDLVGYSSTKCGKVFSTTTDIKVNKVTDGYSILYRSDVINNIDVDVFSNNLIKLFLQNVPETLVTISLIYLYDTDDYDGPSYNMIDMTTVNTLMSLENKFYNLNGNGLSLMEYIRSDNMHYIINAIIQQYNDVNGYSEEDYDESDEYDEEDNGSSDNDYHFLEDIYKNIPGYTNNKSCPDIDSEDEYVELPKKYTQSKILKDSKNAKRSYNRHGVLISYTKKARKHDEKIIKEFLKEFIPGDAEWKKEFRHEVLKRWMKMYSISKSDLKELEKAHNKIKKSKHNNKKQEKALELTSRLFSRASDRWNDPNR